MIYKRRWYRNSCYRPQGYHSVKLCLVLLFVVFVGLFNYKFGSGKSKSASGFDSHPANGRHLLSTATWERCDEEIGHPRNYTDPKSWYVDNNNAYGWLALYVVLILVVFVAIAVICDDFFVPSLEAISESLNLSEDVAGATFMAAGSSAPELFTSIAGVTVESDVGVGTIVGSAVFNLLCICALSAVFAGQTLHLDWRPLCRDSTFYGISIACFIAFSWDGKFELYESIIMLVLYFIYIVLMKFNKRLMRLLTRVNKTSPKKMSVPVNLCDGDEIICSEAKKFSLISEDGLRRYSRVEKGTLRTQGSITNLSVTNLSCTESEMDMPKIPGSDAAPVIIPVFQCPEDTEGAIKVAKDVTFIQQESCNKEEEEEEEEVIPTCRCCPCFGPLNVETPTCPDGGCGAVVRCVFSWILLAVAFPFIVMFTYSIPDCSRPNTKKWYPLSFLMSIIWIAALSFAMVTLVGRAGCIIGIDKFTMGLVVVAIGTSIPDALSSILVARDGFGDMAVSNAIGSNVFDIDLGIGLPFVISSAIKKGKEVHLLSPELEEKWNNNEVKLLPHPKFGFILMILLFMALAIFGMAKFRLTKRLAISFVIVYFLFLIYAFVQELVCEGSC